MSEKLDLFELSVKRGLENYEVPMEEGAWNQFQAHMNNGSGSSSASGKSSSFFGKFGLAAAVLAAAGLFVNYSTEFRQDLLTSVAPEHIESITSTDTHEASGEEEKNYVITTPPSAAEVESIESKTRTLASVKAEDKRILNINKKLQEAADRAELENAELDKKTTTRFVGKNFNLNAASEFSPNGDGTNDIFLPSALTAENRFTMTITSPNGKRVFSSTRLDSPWTGETTAGKLAPEGHYSWEVILHKDNHNTEIFRGVVRLER